MVRDVATWAAHGLTPDRIIQNINKIDKANRRCVLRQEVFKVGLVSAWLAPIADVLCRFGGHQDRFYDARDVLAPIRFGQ